MRKLYLILYLVVTGVIVFTPKYLFAMTVQELQNKIEGGEKITVIDIRNQMAYKNNHISGAINIPAFLMENKKLPPLGRVIVYGDGINNEKADSAVISLNEKKGIQAELLLGGLSAWQSFNLPDTEIVGMKQVGYQYITYQELIGFFSKERNLVLVDLRQDEPNQTLTDLDKLLPDVAVIKPKYQHNQVSKFDLEAVMYHQKDDPPLFVLIANGGEMAEKVYRRLMARRLNRLAILMGGEFSLSRKGKPGQQKNSFNKSGEGQ